MHSHDAACEQLMGIMRLRVLGGRGAARSSSFLGAKAAALTRTASSAGRLDFLAVDAAPGGGGILLRRDKEKEHGIWSRI